MDVIERMSNSSSTATYVASGGTVAVGTLTANEVAAFAGVFIAFATFVVNIVYKHLHYKLAKAQVERDEHEDAYRGAD